VANHTTVGRTCCRFQGFAKPKLHFIRPNALIGILIRNSVILIVQIETLRNEGREAWAAVLEATEHRMRVDVSNRSVLTLLGTNWLVG
jgi:hypothetical protein